MADADGSGGSVILAKRGRKTRLQGELKDLLLAKISGGCSRRSAAAIVGISHSTVANEADRNPEFYAALAKAEAEFEAHHVGRIHRGEKNWQSSAWLLERKSYSRWGDKARMRATVDHTGTLAHTHDVRELTARVFSDPNTYAIAKALHNRLREQLTAQNDSGQANFANGHGTNGNN